MGNCTVGIDLGGTNLRIALVNEKFNILKSVRFCTNQFHSPDKIIENIIANLRVWESDGCFISGIGIGVPGPVNVTTGKVDYMPNLSGWQHFELKKVLEERTGKRIVVTNDADAAAAGEYRVGAMIGESLFIMLTLGTGLGSSVFWNGRAWTGPYGFSPELGHMPLFNNDRICGCGGKNHSETVVSSKALLLAYEKRKQRTSTNGIVLTVSDIFERFRGGCVDAENAIKEYCFGLGRVICAGAVAWSVKKFVIGGGIASSWNIIRLYVEECIKNNGFSPHTDNLTIVKTEIGDEGPLIGAASLVFNSDSDW